MCEAAPIEAFFAPSWVWLALGLATAGLLAAFWVRELLPEAISFWRDALIAAGASLILVCGFSWAVLAGVAFVWASAAAVGFGLPCFPAFYATQWIALPALVLALLLWLLRRRSLAIYGALEIAGALLTIYVVATSRYGSPVQRAGALLGAVYFLIRGLDNSEKGGLISIVHRTLDQRWKTQNILAAALITIGGATTIVVASISPRVAPPYLSSYDGGELPVSAMDCGRVFIICDAPAWRQHDRLKAGTAIDRLRAELDAVERAKKLGILD